MIKLNLGCGTQVFHDWVNVDKEPLPNVDKQWNIEVTPWPWETSSTEFVLMSHVLEHVSNYEGVMKELYRVCKPGAQIMIIVPHPRHDDFLGDPTHVRPITYNGLMQLSKVRNQNCQKEGYADTPFALMWGVNFELRNYSFTLDEPWSTWKKNKEKTEDEIQFAARHYFNVVVKSEFLLEVIKE